MEEGGETAFPHSQWIDEARRDDPTYSDCAKGIVAARARKGDAIMFWGMKPDGG